MYEFEVYGDPKAKGPPPDYDGDESYYGESEFVVLRLTKALAPKKHQVFFDNLFSSPDLMCYLKEKEISAVATLKADRSRGCNIPSEKALKKIGRGTISEFVENDKGVVVCA